jgi:hypothetical protein
MPYILDFADKAVLGSVVTSSAAKWERAKFIMPSHWQVGNYKPDIILDFGL